MVFYGLVLQDKEVSYMVGVNSTANCKGMSMVWKDIFGVFVGDILLHTDMVGDMAKMNVDMKGEKMDIEGTHAGTVGL